MADGSEPHRRVQTPRFAEPCARSAFSGSGTPRSSPLETVESSAEAPHGLPNPSRPRNHVAGTSPPLFEGTISGIFFIEINEIKGVAPKMPLKCPKKPVKSLAPKRHVKGKGVAPKMPGP